jgi:hypothetical protein
LRVRLFHLRKERFGRVRIKPAQRL